MNAEVFFDTNILLYAISKFPAETEKARIANQLISGEDFGLSTQVCQEFYVAATRKIRTVLTSTEAEEFLRALGMRPVAGWSIDLIFRAIDIHRRYQISYWDGAIIAGAKELSVRRIYSEDLAHGQVYEGIEVCNPFRTTLGTT